MVIIIGWPGQRVRLRGAVVAEALPKRNRWQKLVVGECRRGDIRLLGFHVHTFSRGATMASRSTSPAASLWFAAGTAYHHHRCSRPGVVREERGAKAEVRMRVGGVTPITDREVEITLVDIDRLLGMGNRAWIDDETERGSCSARSWPAALQSANSAGAQVVYSLFAIRLHPHIAILLQPSSSNMEAASSVVFVAFRLAISSRATAERGISVAACWLAHRNRPARSCRSGRDR